MGNAINIAHQQKIRLDHYLADGAGNSAQEFFARPEEVEVSQKLVKILNANHPDY